MMFKLLLVLVSITVAVFLLVPLFTRSPKTDAVSRQKVNVQSAATRLAELKQELDNHEINQQEFDQFQRDIENAAADDLRHQDSQSSASNKGNKLLGLIIVFMLPILSVGIYSQIGDQKALLSQQQLLDQALLEAENKILNNPEDVEGRIALAQVYTELQRFADAETMYQQLLELRPNNPDILTAYAEFSALQTNNHLPGEPYELIKRALVLSPDHQRALWLAGFAEIQSENPDKALEYWQRLQSGLEINSDMYLQIQNLIDEVKGISTKQLQDDGTKTALKVSVSIKPDFTQELNPDTTLFVFARAAEGPPMPLAVYRGVASELPLTVKLDDSMAMRTDMSLSKFTHVIVGARLSSTGKPQGSSGDYEGFSEVIDLSQADSVLLEINSIKP